LEVGKISMNKFISFFGILLLLLLCNPLWAQQSRETFGKNRFQYRTFEWQYLSGENFDVYYYDSRSTIASETLTYLESEFDRITDLIGFPPYFKTKIFLYNSLSDLRQSNVGLNHSAPSLGGETEFIKPYVEVAYTGTSQDFKEELLFKTSELLINEMMYGGNLKDIFQNALLLNLPDWFVQGAIYYVSKGWNAEVDDFVRDLVQSKRAKHFSKLTGKEAALAGQSFWNYVAEKYGKSSVHNILNYTRVTRNEEKSLQITLGVSSKKLMADWAVYYKQMAEQVTASYVSPAKENQFTKQPHTAVYYTSAKVSPDGRNIAYAKNDRGQFDIIVKSLESGKEKTILRGGTKVVSQRVDYNLPLIGWADANTLGVVGQKQGNYWFWLYDFTSRTKLPRQLEKFNNIRSINFSANGRLAILSADFEGKNDLYLLSTRRDRIRRLTNDTYDDLDPSFIPNTNRIVFSSNRSTDSLRTGKRVPLAELTNTSNLFVYDLDSTKTLLTRVTNTLSKDFAPRALDANTFYYLSDQRGITNLFKFSITTGIYTQVTNYNSSIVNYDLNTETNTLAIVSTRNLKQNIYVDRSFDANRQLFTPSTRRKELLQARNLRERKAVQENKKMTIKELLNARLKEAAADTLQTIEVPEDSIIAVTDTIRVATDTIPQKTAPKLETEKTLNTDNYTFEDEVEKKPTQTEGFLSRYVRARDKQRVTGPFPYDPKFSANNLNVSFIVDPLRGFGPLIEARMNDMLENYRIYGGIYSAIDFKSGDIYGEFQYLPHYIDFSARFDRKAISWQTVSNNDQPDPDNYNYSLNKLEVGASLPLNDRTRLTFKPFATLTRSVNIGPTALSNPPTLAPNNYFYVGVKSELTYDNALMTGANLIEGTRGKITFIHHENTKNRNLSFSQVSVDMRHYQKLYKEIVFAMRGFAGTFFGNSPKHYLLGGSDNWAFNKSFIGGSSSTGKPNPLGVQGENQELLFVEYVTNLRGFNYATLFGNSALVANAELRVPLVRALSNGPIASNFFRNLQLTAFYDIGTSWTGKPPFSSENSVSFEIINQPPFQIEVKNYLNPWLYSYGLGMRSVILGYYLKFDFAWPVENFKRQDPRLVVTLGYDF
jgi:Tol biopolymer transport system component